VQGIPTARQAGLFQLEENQARVAPRQRPPDVRPLSLPDDGFFQARIALGAGIAEAIERAEDVVVPARRIASTR
jgi:hypothetical protein